MCRDASFWPRVNKIKALLSSLPKSITAIEGSNVEARRAYKSIKSAFNKAEKAIGNFELYLQPQLRQILNDRREFGQTDVTYLMDLLEPSDRRQDLTEEQVHAAMGLLSKKVLKNPAFATKENEIMVELAQWKARTEKFADGQRKYAWDALKATPPIDGLRLWTGFYSDSPLSLVYKALQSVQITAAPFERNWSIRTAIHTKVRNRLDVETASKLTFIKTNLMLEHADLFKKRKWEYEMEEPESEEEPTDEKYSGVEEFDVLITDE